MSKSCRQFLTIHLSHWRGWPRDARDASRRRNRRICPPARRPRSGPQRRDLKCHLLLLPKQRSWCRWNCERDRGMAARSWRANMAALYERRTGPRKVALEPTLAPGRTGTRCAGREGRPGSRPIFRSKADPGPLPARDEDIAFAPLTSSRAGSNSASLPLSGSLRSIWREWKSSIRNCAASITLTREFARAQAKKADEEIAAGQISRAAARHSLGGQGPAGHRRDPDHLWRRAFQEPCARADAAVVQRLDDAGAVLVAKLSMGALALNDIWFGGQTMNPWLLEEGSSGSSAGPGAATAAGLVGFAIGSETEGSIVSPSCAVELPDCDPPLGVCRAPVR